LRQSLRLVPFHSRLGGGQTEMDSARPPRWGFLSAFVAFHPGAESTPGCTRPPLSGLRRGTVCGRNVTNVGGLRGDTMQSSRNQVGVKPLHDTDLARGQGRVLLPYALAAKYPNANAECECSGALHDRQSIAAWGFCSCLWFVSSSRYRLWFYLVTALRFMNRLPLEIRFS